LSSTPKYIRTINILSKGNVGSWIIFGLKRSKWMMRQQLVSMPRGQGTTFDPYQKRDKATRIDPFILGN
jgi:hypothetical protein